MKVDLASLAENYIAELIKKLSKMKEMEKQLSQYKKIVAEQTLEIVVLKDVIEKKL